MDITDLVKKDKEEQPSQEAKDTDSNFYMIPEDAGFLSEVDELKNLLHKHLKDIYSDPSKATDESIKKAGLLLAMLDKYMDVRRDIYMITKTKQFT